MSRAKGILKVPTSMPLGIISLIGQVQLNPWWIAGFSSAEGSFILGKSGLRINAVFAIAVTTTDQHLVWAIRNYFKVGGVREIKRDNTAVLEVNNIEDIVKVIIPFFDKYTIIGNKSLDYRDFREACMLIYSGREDKIRLLQLWTNINTGRDYTLAVNRAMVYSLDMPILSVDAPVSDKKAKVNQNKRIPCKYTKEVGNLISQVTLNPWWIAGFVAGEGSFYINKSSSIKAMFSVSQSVTNQHVLWAIFDYFGKIGSVSGETKYSNSKLTISGIKDLINIILPFFDENYIIGNKALDYADFRAVCLMIRDKIHLTAKGRIKCLEIKNRMNSKRDTTQIKNRAMIFNDWDNLIKNLSISAVRVTLN